MQRLITIGVYTTICIVAVGIGLFVASFFANNSSLPTGFATPVAQDATPPGAPTAPAQPTTAPEPTSAPSSPTDSTESFLLTATPPPIPTDAPVLPTDTAVSSTLTPSPPPILSTDVPVLPTPSAVSSTLTPSPPPIPTDGPVLPTDTAVPALPDYIEYTVQKGDILYLLAVEYDVTIEEILAINQIANPASLTVGEVIRIPRK